MTKGQRGQNSLQRKWEQKLGVPRSDPNFETLLRDALSSESGAVQKSTLYLLGFKEVPARRFGFEAGTIPNWQQKEK